MKKPSERHIFPGNNTSKGFFSYYHYIMPQSQANHIFCLKGGPGVGKSTFMRRVGADLQNEGFDVEFLHCSSDPDSLDGVVFPQLNTALIDGTAPHVVDPINPGAVDEIINLGEYWDLGSIKKHKQQIIDANLAVGKLFKRAYKYLAAAKLVRDEGAQTAGQTANEQVFYSEAQKLIKREFASLPPGTVPGSSRKQFASAITPNGVIHYLNSLVDENYKVYSLAANLDVGAASILKSVCDAAIHKGLDVEMYYCPMDPKQKLEHVIIPNLKLAFVTENEYHAISRSEKTYLDFTCRADAQLSKADQDALDSDMKNFSLLLRQTVDALKQAKVMHDYMETFYVPYMDFDKVNQKSAEITGRILNLAKDN